MEFGVHARPISFHDMELNAFLMSKKTSIITIPLLGGFLSELT